KHYRQKNPIRKNKTRRKIDGFVSGLRPSSEGLFVCRISASNTLNLRINPENGFRFSGLCATPSVG
ncbi:hypothetical protein ACC743_24030, partial [Rhizobium ruizarguesonis]